MRYSMLRVPTAMLHTCCRFKYVNLMKNGTYKALLTQSKGRALYIGLFKTEEEAARAVDVTRVFLV